MLSQRCFPLHPSTLNTQHVSLEVLIAKYIKKKIAKEVPDSNNEAALQKLVDDGKIKEWQTLCISPMC